MKLKPFVAKIEFTSHYFSGYFYTKITYLSARGRSRVFYLFLETNRPSATFIPPLPCAKDQTRYARSVAILWIYNRIRVLISYLWAKITGIVDILSWKSRLLIYYKIKMQCRYDNAHESIYMSIYY